MIDFNFLSNDISTNKQNANASATNDGSIASAMENSSSIFNNKSQKNASVENPKSSNKQPINILGALKNSDSGNNTSKIKAQIADKNNDGEFGIGDSIKYKLNNKTYEAKIIKTDKIYDPKTAQNINQYYTSEGNKFILPEYKTNEVNTLFSIENSKSDGFNANDMHALGFNINPADEGKTLSKEQYQRARDNFSSRILMADNYVPPAIDENKKTQRLTEEKQITADKTITTAQKAAKIALLNKNSGNSVENEGYKEYTQGRDENWCADFVSTMYEKATGGKSPFGHESSTKNLENWAKNNGRYINFDKKDNYQIQPGDILLMARDDEGFGHAAIVAETKNGWIKTIEGNAGDSAHGGDPGDRIIKERHYNPNGYDMTDDSHKIAGIIKMSDINIRS